MSVYFCQLNKYYIYADLIVDVMLYYVYIYKHIFYDKECHYNVAFAEITASFSCSNVIIYRSAHLERCLACAFLQSDIISDRLILRGIRYFGAICLITLLLFVLFFYCYLFITLLLSVLLLCCYLSYFFVVMFVAVL